jgi:hypothetical protein
MKWLINASEERADFFELIGTWVTFAGEIITIGGQITHEKGEKAFISDVVYKPGYWSRLCPDIWIAPKISAFQINGVPGHLRPDAFTEYRNK